MPAPAPRTISAPPDWDDTLIQLYSFSKAYRLTGHRVGAWSAGPARCWHEAEKFLDTVTICPNQLGQIAALWGLRNLGEWLAGERAEILDRRAAIPGMPALRRRAGELLGCGAYFAYLEHPFADARPGSGTAKSGARGGRSAPAGNHVHAPEGDPAGSASARRLRQSRPAGIARVRPAGRGRAGLLPPSGDSA